MQTIQWYTTTVRVLRPIKLIVTLTLLEYIIRLFLFPLFFTHITHMKLLGDLSLTL